MTVWVDKIYYTQKGCAARFRGVPYAGRPLEEAIANSACQAGAGNGDDAMAFCFRKDMTDTAHRELGINNLRLQEAILPKAISTKMQPGTAF